MSNLSLWHMDRHRSILRDETKQPNENLVCVKSLYSMISTGTERMVALQRVGESLITKMSVPHMQGSFTLPIKYGYSLVGKTLEGKLVHLLHPHQQTAHVHPECLFELPANASPKRMTLISNMETVINAIWDSEHILGPSNHSSVEIAICGFGNIGALLALTLRTLFSASVTVIEADEWRKDKATQLGFQTCHPDENNKKFDLIYHTSSTEKGLQWCIEQANYEGSIIELSWYVDKLVTLKLGEHFHYNRLRLISSQVSNIPKSKPEETYVSRKQYAVKLLANEQYDALFAEDILLTDTPAFFDKLRSDSLPKGLIWCVKYP